MTVPVATRRAGPYTGNGVTTSFAFDFKVFDDADLRVVLRVIATGVETDLVLDSDYSVTLNGDQDADPGGSITYPLSGSPMASTHKLTAVSNMGIAQPTDLPNQGPFFGDTVEDALDRTVMLIGQMQETLSRAVVVEVSSGTDPADLLDDIDTAVAAAAASAAAAATAETNAETAETNAETAETNAEAAATAAAASAVAAAAAADSIGFRDVVFLTSADSPYTVAQATSGKLLSIDTSGGAVTVTLPTIAGLTLPFTVGVKKATGDSNAVTINRGGSDTFDDGTTSQTLAAVGGLTLIPDTDSSPDKWSVAAFGTGGGQQQKQQFTAGVGFTAGVSTTVTLTETPLPSSEDAITVYQDGVYQQESEWSYAAGVVTFGTAIGGGVAKIEVVWVTPLAIGTPADGTVSPSKFANSSQALTDGATVAWDLASGEVATWAIGGNRTLSNPTNVKTGTRYALKITQDGTGGRTVTWGANYTGINGAAMPQPNSAIDAITIYFFTSLDGSTLQLTSSTKQPTRTVLTSGAGATYTRPAGATSINVLCKGGGGNGNSGGAGSANGGGGGGGGGGEGGTAVKLIVGPSATYTYTVGGAGSNSTFGSLTGGLGSGGAAGSTTPRAGIGGSGGTASGGDYNIQGAPGASADNGGGGNNVNVGGLGGNGGGQGGGIGGSAGNNGAAAGQYGAGGGGGGGGDGAAGSAGNGGAGSAGVIVVDEYYD